MAERIVIDASVAVAFLREEERTADVVGSIQRWGREGAERFVPSPFWLEVLNVLVRRHGWDAEPAAPYPQLEALAAWAHSAIVGAHIAELRARAAPAPARSGPSG